MALSEFGIRKAKKLNRPYKLADGGGLFNRYFEFGTASYPEKEARRLRATNIAAFFIAASMVLFQAISPGWPELITVVFIAAIASIPLTHRFGVAAAPLVLVALLWIHVSRDILDDGTGDGVFLALISAAPLSILLIGIERLWLAAIVSIVSAAVVILLHQFVPPNTGGKEPSEMWVNFNLNVLLNTAVLFGVVAYVARIAARAEAAAESERRRSDALLLNILPGSVAERLRNAPGELIADRYEAVSVLFADIIGFTERSSMSEPEEVVRFLNTVFGAFDAVVARHGLEKIKTLGDGYLVVSGVPIPRSDHAEALARVAFEMRDEARKLPDFAGLQVNLRIGIASGPVVAGVVGTSKFFYDIWGDAVNMASRMEATGVPDRIHLAPATARLLEGLFRLVKRGRIKVKGKGQVMTWFLETLDEPTRLKQRRRGPAPRTIGNR